MGALGILAAVVVLIGGVQTTMVMSESDRLAAESKREPVVEVMPIQADRSETHDTSSF